MLDAVHTNKGRCLALCLVPTICLVFQYACMAKTTGLRSIPMFTPIGGGAEASMTPLVPPVNGRMHVLVTGGAGYIGSHTVMNLLERNHTVTVIDDLSRGNYGAITVLQNVSQPGRLRFVRGSLSNRDLVRSALLGAGVKVDLVIHFAAVAYVGESMHQPLAYYRNISGSSLVLFEEMQHAGISRLIFSSTCATYGNPEKLPVTEETPTRPMSPYGWGKLHVEQMIRDMAAADRTLQVGILRYFNVYGCDPKSRLGEWPRPALQQRHGRITNACLDAAQGTIPHVKIMGTQHPTPDGTCIRDFIHVWDLVDAHLELMGKLSNPPVLFNVGTGKGVSVRELVTACRMATGVNFTVVEQKESRPGDMAAVWADPSKIFNTLGWRPRYTNVTEGLRHCWDWRTLHPQGFRNNENEQSN